MEFSLKEIELRMAVEWYFENRYKFRWENGWSKRKKKFRVSCSFTLYHPIYEDVFLSRSYRGWGNSWADALVNSHIEFLKDKKRVAFKLECVEFAAL